MLNKLKPKSEFTRNVLTLMTGTTIAQAIPIAISPILTRIYTPEDFGVFALFLAISSIFGSIANGRYELAIMLPKKDEDAINIFALGFIITSFISLILLLIVFIFHDSILKLLNNKDISVWLYFVPIAVFFTGLFNILNYFNNRKKQYKDLAKANVVKSIVLAIVQLLVGFLKAGVSGLITGQLLSQMFANAKLFKNIFQDKILISQISKLKVIALAKRYKDFPKFSMWAILANVLSVQLLNILISIFYGVMTLGYYSLVQKVLGIPTLVIGNSIAQVFFQKATEERQKTGKITNTFNATALKVFIIGIVFFGLLLFIVEDVFAIVFGENWRIAGVYAKIIIPIFFIRFIMLPFILTPIIFNKVKIDLLFQIGLLICYLSVFLFGNLFDFEFKTLLYALSVVISLYYMTYSIFLNLMKNGGV